MSYVCTMASLRDRIDRRISRAKGAVFLRADFADLGGYDQVGRALGELERQGRLIRIGYGVFARARKSSLSGRLIPVADIGALAREALAKLRVEVAPTPAERAYAAGESTQVPTGRVIGVRQRIARKIGFDRIEVSYRRVD